MSRARMRRILFRTGTPPRFFQSAGCALGLLFVAPASAAPTTIPLEIPHIADDRLQITLYADAPEIVTPIGAAVDEGGRLFVLESHTHLAPKNYAGPKRDRITIFDGAREDGRAARVSVFAEDVLEGMNLAFAPDGTLHVITAKTVVALRDRDGDGRADESKILLCLETEERYPHNQLLGITISHDGWVYASRGNTGGSPHAWVAADGTRLEAYGNGGDIVRCRLDGTRLERVATGFWNPFDLKFDSRGRLLCVDNDPDSRGPNRLVHVVMGGDYGFKSLYGPSGLHPYNAWDGELPGTLPMIAGIGESPSGVIDLSHAALPPDYRGAVAATIWAEHTIPIYRPKPAGVSLRATAEPFIRGGKWFRPVAIVAAPDGTLYVTDWVLKDYPNHGQGRIWKITTKPGLDRMKPPPPFAAPVTDAGLAQLERLMAAGAGQLAEIRAGLKDRDPFLRHAAIGALARPELRSAAVRQLESAEPALRLGALLALRRAGGSEAESWLKPRLGDPDEEVRLMALIWAGEQQLRALLPEVDAAGSQPNVTPRLFETWLATLQILRTPPAAAGAKRVRGFAIKRDLDSQLLERVVADEQRPAAVRAFALRRIVGTRHAAHRELLVGLARRGGVTLRIEAMRSLAVDADDDARALLREIALDRGEPSRVRAEAVVALGPAAASTLQPLLHDRDPVVKTQAARTLRIEHADAKANARRPAAGAADEWVKRLATGGDGAAGERVFFSLTSTCAQCHRVNGRGGTVGPDLSVIARTAGREQLVRSIVVPSAEIAPQFQGWEVKTITGEVHTGLQGHWRTGGAATLILLDGKEARFTSGQIASFRAMEESLMPEGLAALFSVEELRDLVAFLEQLK